MLRIRFGVSLIGAFLALWSRFMRANQGQLVELLLEAHVWSPSRWRGSYLSHCDGKTLSSRVFSCLDNSIQMISNYCWEITRGRGLEENHSAPEYPTTSD